MTAPMAELVRAASLIRTGRLVAFPTETVYGLGADAFNPTAVARIFEAKRRPRFDPLIVHIHDTTQLDVVAQRVPDRARALIARFWPGPLTIVVPKTPAVPDIVTAGLPNVGVRMPNNRIARELIRQAQTPVAAPSANRFGHISPTCALHVQQQLKGRVDLILDGGPCAVGIESTIVSFCHNDPVLLRPGGIPREEIEALIGPLAVPKTDALTDASPGRSLRHYAPNTPAVLGGAPLLLPGLRKGLLTFTTEAPNVTREYKLVEVLSPRGDLAEAACNLFAALARLDQANLDLIIIKQVPNRGLGEAINDRLMRASRSKRD